MNKTIIASVIGLVAGAGLMQIVPQSKADVYTKIDDKTIQVEKTVTSTINIDQVQRMRDSFQTMCDNRLATFDEQLNKASDLGVKTSLNQIK